MFRIGLIAAIAASSLLPTIAAARTLSFDVPEEDRRFPTPAFPDRAAILVAQAEHAARQGRKAEGVELLREAAALGNGRAAKLLGDSAAHGVGMAKDRIAAAQWYRLGALAGEGEAMLALGIVYANGDGAELDRAEAAYWLQAASESSNPRIMRDAHATLRKLRL